MTFTELECYQLFLAVDDRVRQLEIPPAELLALRERLLSVYRAKHGEPSPADEQPTPTHAAPATGEPDRSMDRMSEGGGLADAPRELASPRSCRLSSAVVRVSP